MKTLEQAVEQRLSGQNALVSIPIQSEPEITVPNDDFFNENMWTFTTDDNSLDSVLNFPPPAPPSSLKENPPASDSHPPADMGQTPLHLAVCNGNESITRLLLKHGADIRKQDKDGRTALHLAVEHGNEGIVRTLLQTPACVNVKDSQGRTALFRAIQVENETIAKQLLDASIEVNCRDLTGKVALHLAVELGSEALTLLLLTYGADVDA